MNDTEAVQLCAEDAADDLVDALYAEWLMEQPEACICNGDTLLQRMEQQWGYDRFVRDFSSRVAKAQAAKGRA